jgi:hypothetical protein
MWIFLPEGFFSVACAHKPDGSVDANVVMIRARRKAHLQNLQKRFPAMAGAEILVTPNNDYRYRVTGPKGPLGKPSRRNWDSADLVKFQV